MADILKPWQLHTSGKPQLLYHACMGAGSPSAYSPAHPVIARIPPHTHTKMERGRVCVCVCV